MSTERLLVDLDKNHIKIEDLGVTLRRVFAAAVTGYESTEQRTWKLVYKGAVVGSVRVKDDHLKGKKANARYQISVAKRTGQSASTAAAENADGTGVVVDQRPSEHHTVAAELSDETHPGRQHRIADSADGEARDAGNNRAAVTDSAHPGQEDGERLPSSDKHAELRTVAASAEGGKAAAASPADNPTADHTG